VRKREKNVKRVKSVEIDKREKRRRELVGVGRGTLLC
jgi:hypothetical protein